MKKRIALLVSILLLLTACAPQAAPPSDPSGEPAAPTVSQPSEPIWVNLGLLKGPIGMGAARLMKEGGAENNYDTQVFTGNDEVVAGLTNGSLDIAGMATNLAVNLYNKTNGAVRMIAVNTLGVLYILENGNSVQSVGDLTGKTIYAMGQGANPEYILRYLIERNGGVYGDVNIEWRTQEEITALMLSGEPAICMLPVPAATTVLLRGTDVRVALDLTEEWNAVTPDSRLAQSCIVARTAFIEEHPEAVQSFLSDLAAAVDLANADPDRVGVWAEEFGIVPSAAIAAAAIPQANLVCITGDDMRSAVQGYCEVLFAADPASIGGANPDDAFYYLGE